MCAHSLSVQRHHAVSVGLRFCGFNMCGSSSVPCIRQGHGGTLSASAPSQRRRFHRVQGFGALRLLATVDEVDPIAGIGGGDGSGNANTNVNEGVRVYKGAVAVCCSIYGSVSMSHFLR